MKLTTLPEPLLEFGVGTHVCPRTGIEHLGVYDKRDELRRTELRIGVVGRGEGIDLLDDWLEKCRDGIQRKESKLLNLFRRRLVSETLHECGGNRSEAARRLGMDPSNLRALIKRLGIES